MTPVEECDAAVGGYDGMFGVYCDKPKGHDGPHHDNNVVWYYEDEVAK